MSEIWRPSRLTRQQMEERRLAALPFLSDRSVPSPVLAQRFGVAPSVIRYWRQRLARGESFEATRSTGRPSFLSDAQVAEIMEWIQAGPDPEQYPDGRWTTARIREQIGLKYGVWYDKDWLGKLLKRWGFSWQKAQKRPLEQKESQVAQWLEAELPALEKKIEAGETVVWADEVGISMKPVVGNTWATRGKTPTIFAKTNWEKLSVIGGITSQGQFFQQTHEGSIKAPGFIAFLTHLLRHIEGKLTVVVDNAKIHRAKIVTEFVAKHERLTITYLPPYSPELNPIELVWAYVKRHCLANFCPENLEQLKAYLRTIWPKIRYRQIPSKLLGIQDEVLET